MNNYSNPSELTAIQKLVLDKFPYPVSNVYSELLISADVQGNTLRLIQSFEYLVKLFSLVLISQYLKSDIDALSNTSINQMLSSKLPYASLGTWVEILFSLVKIYQQHPEIDLFVPELKELSSKNREIFTQIVMHRNEFFHKPPESVEHRHAKFNQLHQLSISVFESLSFVSNYRLLQHISDEKIHIADNRVSLEIFDENPDILIGTTYLKNSQNSLLELTPFVIGVQTNNSLLDFALLDRWTPTSARYISYLRQESIKVEQESFLAKLRIIPHEKHVRKPKVFISYAKQDADFSNQVLEFFSSIKCEVWIDKINLLPGQDWEYEIKKAIDESDFFVACLSSKSVSKVGFVQKELKLAISVLEKFPEGKVFIIPIRLDDCQIPSQLAKYHYVDWLAENTKELLRKTVTQ